MITPNKLEKGDKIGIIAPARKIKMSEIEASIKVFQKWGLRVELSENLFEEYFQYAGTEKQRVRDIQLMLDNPEIKAIVCARGGYGTVKILSDLNFENFITHPKWIIGYSDITALHSYLNKIVKSKTIHGTMPINFPKDCFENEAIISLKGLLFGDSFDYKLKDHSYNRMGEVEGELVGGNLSVLYSLSGTNYDLDTRGKILVIEDLDEYLYHIDRMMMNLKYAGKLKNLKGLIVGGMTEMNDNIVPYGRTAYEIIADAIKEYTYPVCFNFPVGHIENNMALILGAKINLKVCEKEVLISYS